jgi:hypothetical protein
VPEPTGMVAVTAPASSITDTVSAPVLATWTVPAARSTATPYGPEPTGMVTVTV